MRGLRGRRDILLGVALSVAAGLVVTLLLGDTPSLGLVVFLVAIPVIAAFLVARKDRRSERSSRRP